MRTKKTLFMETTEVPAQRTALEIGSLLVESGATQIATYYDMRGQIIGLRWTMKAAGRDLLFAMPARVDPIYKIFCQRKKITPIPFDGSTETMQKAHRVAWRQLLRWTQAQLAMIDCGMAEASEVFLPYWQVDGNNSLFELFKGSEFKALPSGGANAQT
jgi:hypothetical protein